MTKKLTLMGMAMLMTALMATTALAQWRGPGGGGPGYGWCGGPGGALGPADKATDDLQAKLWARKRALYDELAQAKPNAAKVKALTREVNALRAKLFDRVTQYQLKNPDARRYAWGRGRRGGYGRHLGYGPRGGGCW
ncbi:MAG: hypothetical protein KJ621_18025 [Proteobacteria bacterium]|nr:hypothetical protein [Pseudomonadota bacterium]